MAGSVTDQNSENEVFNRLRRIPIRELETRLENLCHLISGHAVLAARHEFRKNQNWKIFKKRSDPVDLIFDGNWELHQKTIFADYDTIASQFQGTGWTPFDYYEEIKKSYFRRYQRERERNRKTLVILCCSLIIGATLSGVVAASEIYFPFAIGLSLLGGLVNGYLTAKILIRVERKYVRERE